MMACFTLKKLWMHLEGLHKIHDISKYHEYGSMGQNKNGSE